MKSTSFYILGALLLLVSCKEPFIPELEPTEKSFLVVEGYINLGQGAVTTVKLSRTLPLQDPEAQQPETGATLTIEEEGANAGFTMQEQTAGVYVSEPLKLEAGKNYRVKIKTKNGKIYASTYETGKATPAIDEVIWKWEKDGIRIYVNSHDPLNNTRYYHWTFEDVWQIQSVEKSYFRYENGKMIERTPLETEQMFTCWGYGKSSDLLLGSTAGLSQDTISFPVTAFGHHTSRTKIKYSIEVTQHALSQQEFFFLQGMKKNTSEMGGFFDPQPSEALGNIQNLADSNEIVVGYLGAYSTQKKRLFIRKEDLPEFPTKDKCNGTYSPDHPDSLQVAFGSGAFLPTSKITGEIENVPFTMFLGLQAICVDCRIFGKSEKPSYW
ncbi:DUF4249 domain-containing protein [Rufibacter immobilis]|uniref:DUF4249 domain-containing protein n=1 Tax=Rufibacter immobilis TaxID=1348778 RepID=A0A3M9MQZ4_9BACT|nr:DUF4249 domain-containing protein [Rufibacter immobilis]RNI27962.1 DUF4249 domain-containing protein [Rufibacter immobilis]